MKQTITTLITLPMLVAMLLAGPIGCETMSGHKRTTSGAAVGAAAGAGVGALLSDKDKRWEGAAVGAAAGAAVGGAVGYYLDRQAKKYAQIDDVDVIPVPAAEGQQEHLVLEMGNTILFGHDSSDLSAEGAERLGQMAVVMREYPETKIYVKAYASSDGAEDYNQKLTERRAASVGSALITAGVAQSRITMIGMGESNPIASNATAEGRAQNRRVEIEIFPTN